MTIQAGMSSIDQKKHKSGKLTRGAAERKPACLNGYGFSSRTDGKVTAHWLSRW